jgi:hypothetical protein
VSRPWRSGAAVRAALVVGVTLLAGAGLPPRAAADMGFSDPQTGPLYEPGLGMDPDGRIPKVAMPEDLPRPDRWRYIPEGRIPPGAMHQRLLSTSFITPQIFFESDVGLGGGLALTDIDFRNQRRREFLGAFLTYTTEGQQRYRLLWRRWLHHRELPAGGVALEERSYIGAAGGYDKTLTRRFFGLGPDTAPGAESSYTDEVASGGVGGELALPGPGGDWVLGAGLGGEHHNLAPGKVSGRPTTDQAFPELFDAGDGYDALTLSLGLRWDTRDSQHQPYRGWRIGAAVEAPVWQSTGDSGAVLVGFASVVIPVPPLFHDGGDPGEENPPTDTLALGVTGWSAAGDLPFFSLPSLGGSNTLRGYIGNRFTDRAAWHASAEYRLWLIPRGFRLTRTIRIERVGIAPFFDVGTVAGSLDRLGSARIHMSYGLGLRAALERIATFRVDLGWSGEGMNFSVGFGLPF